ncbi:MAG: aminotransferase class I/II-fold pyridoxal phosphate-dependent enzyme [Chloroflexota bacterium]
MNNQSFSNLDLETLDILRKAIEKMDSGFSYLQPAEKNPINNQLESVLLETAQRLQDNYPYFHPLYAGQMLKPPHPAARLAYMLAMWINPNNHALDGGKASSQMEKEAVREIAGMFGWDTYLGHLTGGGTMANLEALWVAGKINPDGIVLASDQAHYTHSRISSVLKLNYESIASDRLGRMDLNALQNRLERGGIGTVVVTIGTTATGSIDPLLDILKLRKKYGFRIHVDSAYGGYFKLAGNLSAQTAEIYEHIHEADSIVVDPHKHGLQPYGCGCILFKDPSVGRFYKHNSPYTYFSSSELHLGEISLECSRPGAAAVGLWATQKLLPLVKGGEFAKGLEAGREAALILWNKLYLDKRFITAFNPELDIIIWIFRAKKVSAASELAKKLFEEAEKEHLYLALANLPISLFDLPGDMEQDEETITCMRSVLMKPEHKDWVEQIWNIIDHASARLIK